MTQDNEILSEADEFAALLPWYVSGKISAADKARVDPYLAALPEADKQLVLAREEADEVFAANQSIIPPRDALDTLRASLAKSPSARLHAVEASLLDRLGVFLASLSPRKLALAGVAAALAVALQTATIGALVRTVPGQKDEMTGTFALVAFQPAAPAGTLSAFLADSGYTILEGPKAGGMYRLRISPAILTDAERDALIEKLKARTDLISFASAASSAK
jgi:hypothetical protein